MNNCSTYEYINFKNGILDNIIDAVYVILLLDSPRTDSVYRQINELKLSKHNIIQINKKYKDCHIDLCEQKPHFHLYYNLVNIFKHANINNFNNILVLEDDFIFDPEIKDKHIINDLENFINFNDFDMYCLGNTGFVIPTFNLKHLRLKSTGLSHSLIFPKKSRDKVINDYKNNKCIINPENDPHHDIQLNYILDKKYVYYKPLCYQPLEITENQLNWDNKLWLKINQTIFSLIEIDKKPKIGFIRLYLISYTLSALVYFVIFFVFYKLILKMKA